MCGEVRFTDDPSQSQPIELYLDEQTPLPEEKDRLCPAGSSQ